MTNPFASRRRKAIPTLLVALSLLAAACGGGGDGDEPAAAPESSAAPAGGSTASSAAGGNFLADTQQRLEKWYAGTERPLPTSSPKPQPGTKVWVISCGQAAEGCAVPSNAAKEAGDAIGWDVTIFDGKLDPSQYSTGVRQAVAAGAKGIILNVVDCPLVRQALQEAKTAGVKIFGLHSLDCNDPAVGGQPLFDAELFYGNEFPDYRRLVIAFGGTKADWIIAKTEAKAKTIQFRQDELLVVKYINDGFEERFKQCTTCELVETVKFVLADLGPGLQQKAQGALLQNPDANSVMVPYDSAMTLGIDAAIVGSGRADELQVMGGEGFVSNIQAVRDGRGQDAGTGYGFDWEGWASIDGVNRLIQGQPQVDCGCGFAVWDKDHNFPPEGKPFQPKADFRSNYRKIWGLAA